MLSLALWVSHNHDAGTFATQFVSDLRQAGANAWLDKDGLGAGNFQQCINKVLARCKRFVPVLTPSALALLWVQQEVDAANRLKYSGQSAI
jgi:hypothetical protein